MSKTAERLEQLEQIISDLPASHPLWKKAAEEYPTLKESNSEMNHSAQEQSEAQKKHEEA